jgi:preprotein translocase subunit Sss1
MSPDPDRKPTKDEMRQGGKVALAVLVFMGIFTAVIVWISG